MNCCALLRESKRDTEKGMYCKVTGISSKNLQIINAGEDVEKREPSYTVGGNVN